MSKIHSLEYQISIVNSQTNILRFFQRILPYASPPVRNLHKNAEYINKIHVIIIRNGEYLNLVHSIKWYIYT